MRPFHFRQWLYIYAVKIVTSYFSNLFLTCQQVLGHACHIWYSLWLKSLTHNHSTRAGPLCNDGHVRQEVKRPRECPEALEIFFNGFKRYLQIFYYWLKRMTCWCLIPVRWCGKMSVHKSVLSNMAELSSFSPPASESTLQYRTSPPQQARMRSKLKAAPVYI